MLRAGFRLAVAGPDARSGGPCTRFLLSSMFVQSTTVLAVVQFRLYTSWLFLVHVQRPMRCPYRHTPPTWFQPQPMDVVELAVKLACNAPKPTGIAFSFMIARVSYRYAHAIPRAFEFVTDARFIADVRFLISTKILSLPEGHDLTPHTPDDL